MKEYSSRTILLLTDAISIAIAILLAFGLRQWCDCFERSAPNDLIHYLQFGLIYGVVLVLFYVEGIYTKRYDFWQELERTIKAVFLSGVIVFAVLAMTKHSDSYSRFIVIMVFIILAALLPLQKYLLKRFLFTLGLWQRKAKIYGNDEFIKNSILENAYLGYIDALSKEPKTVFINSYNFNLEQLKEIIDTEIRHKHEVIFIPLLNDYNLTYSSIYQSFNTRTNFVVLQNRLKSRYRLIFQQVFNYTLAILLLPVLIPVIGIIAFLIKKESPGPIFFAHNRIGQNGTIIPTFKFRSMFQDAKERLEKLLLESDVIRQEWEHTFKLKDDPRVTKIGAFLRKTSLDELPQIFNVLRGEMNFVGPRPVVQEEIDKYYKKDSEYYYIVKPGITGLWQVSGRSDTDYDFRIKTDKWYVINWSLWLDIVILLKTVKVVLYREGAY